MAVLAHVLRREPAGVEHRRHVDGHDAVPVLERVVPGGRDRPVDAGVVDEDVDAAEARDGVGEGGLDLLPGRDVHARRVRRREAGCVERRKVAVPRDHARAALGHQPGDAEPDAARGAGDDRDLSVEPGLHALGRALRTSMSMASIASG
jgi:hypothetical protein